MARMLVPEMVQKKLAELRHSFKTDSLFRNSVYLMGSTFVVAFFGFLYWVLAAHLYTTRSVGLATTIVAISNVVMILSVLGYDNSFIRFLPKSKNANTQLNTGFTVSTLAALLVSIVYLFAIHLFVPKLSFVNSSVLWTGFFILFMIVNMLNFLNNYPFIAYRITYIVFAINTAMGVFRLMLLFPLAKLGLNGLLLSNVIALGAAMVATFYFMYRKMGYRARPLIDLAELRRTGRYTFNSYISMVFLTLPTYILPTLVISRLGVTSAAYYYIVAVIIAALNVIPMATAQSLFAEGVWRGEQLAQHVERAAKVVFSLMIPAVLILVIGGKIILTIFGNSYAGAGYGLLVLLALSALPKSVSYLFSTVLRIEHKVGMVAAVYLLYAVVVLGGSFVGIRTGHGLDSIGWATLAAEIITAVLYAVAYVARASNVEQISGEIEVFSPID